MAALISADNYIPITWATHVDLETGRPVEVAGSRYRDETFLLYPSYLGGHNWHPMSYNPSTGLVYIPVLDIPANYAQDDGFAYRADFTNLGTDQVIGGLPDSQAERDALRALIQGRLVAWDPKTQKEAWRVEHKGSWNGGTLTTAGNLVFQGTADGKFKAFTADTGQEVWSYPTQTGVVAPATTFELDGEQFVSVNVGWGGAFALVFGEFVQDASLPNVSRVLTFKLGGTQQLPEPDWRPTVAFDPPPQTADAATIKKGHRLFQDTCMGCHGLNAVSGLLVPDLRGSGFLKDQASWDTVVREGRLAQQGDGLLREGGERRRQRRHPGLRHRAGRARPDAPRFELGETRRRSSEAARSEGKPRDHRCETSRHSASSWRSPWAPWRSAASITWEANRSRRRRRTRSPWPGCARPPSRWTVNDRARSVSRRLRSAACLAV